MNNPTEPRMTDLPSSVAVLGAGTMGSGIATVFAANDIPVTIVARRESSLATAKHRIESAFRNTKERAETGCAGAVPAGRWKQVRYTTAISEACQEVALIVETIGEDLQAKRTVFAEVAQAAPAEAILTSNTSSLPLDDVLAGVPRPGRAAGLHWFNPADSVSLVEVVTSAHTHADTAAQLTRWMISVGKNPVQVSRPVLGFVANRLQYALLREAYALVANGVCELSDIDTSVTEALGPRWAAVGPFQSMDLAGLDIHLAVARQLFRDLSTDPEVPALLEDLVSSGDLGCKSGRGMLGGYSQDDVHALARRREAVASAIRKARDRVDSFWRG